MAIDLEKEQRATLERPRYRYSAAARMFFFMMDMITGRKTTPAKAKLIEILASIPYRSWEIRQYARLTRMYGNAEETARAERIVEWAREAQDNEYMHLLLIDEKMKEDGLKDPWYLFPPIPWLMTAGYTLMTRVMAVLNMGRAYLFNAEFEDHAEHVYAKFVEDHPELEEQRVRSDVVARYGDFETWADVFRRIGLDERDHMNSSFALCGRPEHVVRYEGMPALPDQR